MILPGVRFDPRLPCLLRAPGFFPRLEGGTSDPHSRTRSAPRHIAVSRQWFPLYVNDYLGDTSRLTTVEHGAYLLILIDYFAKGGPPPDDASTLQAITKLSPYSWKILSQKLKQFFHVENGFWRHARMDAEIEKANKYSEIQAERRRGKTKPPINRRLTGGLSTDKPPTPTPISKKKIPTVSIDGFDRFYEIYPRHVGRGQAEKAFKTAAKSVPLETLLAGAERYADERSTEDPAFTKHPATWLNGKCWDDDPAPRSTGAKVIESPFGQRVTAHHDKINSLMEKATNGTGNGRASSGPNGKAIGLLPDLNREPGILPGGTGKKV